LREYIKKYIKVIRIKIVIIKEVMLKDNPIPRKYYLTLTVFYYKKRK
jgi:hypothetical protein